MTEGAQPNREKTGSKTPTVVRKVRNAVLAALSAGAL